MRTTPLTANDNEMSNIVMLGKNVIDIQSHNKHLQNELHIAVHNGDMLEAKKAIVFGININAQDDIGETALHVAVDQNNYEMVELLLRHKANPNVANNVGNTALHVALIYNVQLKIIKLLSQYGSNFEKENDAGDTPINLFRQDGLSHLSAVDLAKQAIDTNEVTDLSKYKLES